MRRKFDYFGMSENDLSDLCDDKYVFAGYTDWKYWTSEFQSHGKYLRLYGFYPKWLPLYIFMSHGVDLDKAEDIYPFDLKHDAYCMLYMYSRKIPYFKKKSSTPCYPMKSLFAYCRKRNHFRQSASAKGTLFFFSHSTESTENRMDLEKLFQELKMLPEKMQPVCICLHMTDVHKGVHKKFIENGFPVYSAGNNCDIRFAERWYKLVKNFKYTASNTIGSYVCYSVEMGIPFFYYGSEPVTYNLSDDNIPLGRYAYEDEKWYQEVAKLFSYNDFEIRLTDEQIQFTNMRLGLETGLSRKEMSKILWKAYFSRENIFLLLKRMVFFIMTFPIKEIRRQSLSMKLNRQENRLR